MFLRLIMLAMISLMDAIVLSTPKTNIYWKGFESHLHLLRPPILPLGRPLAVAFIGCVIHISNVTPRT